METITKNKTKKVQPGLDVRRLVFAHSKCRKAHFFTCEGADTIVCCLFCESTTLDFSG